MKLNDGSMKLNDGSMKLNVVSMKLNDGVVLTHIMDPSVRFHLCLHKS